MATPPKKPTSTKGASVTDAKRAAGSKKTVTPEMGQVPGPVLSGDTAPSAAPRLEGRATPPPPAPEAAGLRDAIARRAYELYEAEGRPQGRSEEHWRQAEAEVAARAGAQARRA